MTPRHCAAHLEVVNAQAAQHPIIAFIKARLAEDETINANMLAWLHDLPIELGRPKPYDPARPSVASTVCDGVFTVAVPLPADDRRVEAWMVRFDPARAQRQVDVVARILQLHEPLDGAWCSKCVVLDDDRPRPEAWPCENVCVLAVQWESHPDFDPAWLPETG